jgi:hypothetical protein
MSDRGSIKDGMRATFVMLGSNPLVDIKNTKEIKGILGSRKEVLWR